MFPKYSPVLLLVSQQIEIISSCSLLVILPASKDKLSEWQVCKTEDIISIKFPVVFSGRGKVISHLSLLTGKEKCKEDL